MVLVIVGSGFGHCNGDDAVYGDCWGGGGS